MMSQLLQNSGYLRTIHLPIYLTKLKKKWNYIFETFDFSVFRVCGPYGLPHIYKDKRRCKLDMFDFRALGNLAWKKFFVTSKFFCHWNWFFRHTKILVSQKLSCIHSLYFKINKTFLFINRGHYVSFEVSCDKKSIHKKVSVAKNWPQQEPYKCFDYTHTDNFRVEVMFLIQSFDKSLIINQ